MLCNVSLHDPNSPIDFFHPPPPHPVRRRLFVPRILATLFSNRPWIPRRSLRRQCAAKKRRHLHSDGHRRIDYHHPPISRICGGMDGDSAPSRALPHEVQVDVVRRQNDASSRKRECRQSTIGKHRVLHAKLVGRDECQWWRNATIRKPLCSKWQRGRWRMQCTHEGVIYWCHDIEFSGNRRHDSNNPNWAR